MSLRSSDIASVTLPSLDPPGEKHDLPPPYNQPPFKRGPLTDEAIERVSIMNPLPRLHRSLIPDLNETWKPPVLLYGWSTRIGDLLPMLLEYAEEHQLLVYGGGSTKPPSRSGDSDDSDSDVESVHWGDTDEEDDQEEEERYVEKYSSAQCFVCHRDRSRRRHAPYYHQHAAVHCLVRAALSRQDGDMHLLELRAGLANLPCRH